MAEAEKKKTCFIITPIGNPDDPIRRHIDGVIDGAIIPAFGEKYTIIPPHRIMSIGSITKQVIEHIYKSDLVIANLTGLNPNVMYELAFRHSVGKPVIVIAEEGTKLPFDIKDDRTFYYKNDVLGVLDLKARLLKIEPNIVFDDSIKTGMIYDYLRQIGIEERIINAVNNADGDADSQLGLILDRFRLFEDNMKRLVLSQSVKNDSQIQGKNYDVVIPSDLGPSRYIFELSIESDDFLNMDNYNLDQFWRRIKTALYQNNISASTHQYLGSILSFKIFVSSEQERINSRDVINEIAKNSNIRIHGFIFKSIYY